MAKRVTTIKCRIQDDFVDFSFNIDQLLRIYNLYIYILQILLDNGEIQIFDKLAPYLSL